MIISEIEFDILKALTCKVRVLSKEQILRAWSEPDSRQLLFSVERLISLKLVKVEIWEVVVPQTKRTPLFTWKPNERDPDTWTISENARNRWRRQSKTVFAYQATQLAGRLFGSRSGKEIRTIERQHDLLLGEVYVNYLRSMPDLAERWYGEDTVPQAPYGVKNPDAFLFDDELKPRRVIESTGAYSQKQVKSFHKYCRINKLPYELW